MPSPSILSNPHRLILYKTDTLILQRHPSPALYLAVGANKKPEDVKRYGGPGKDTEEERCKPLGKRQSLGC